VVAADLPAAMLACARRADPLLPLVRADAEGTVRLPVSAVIGAGQRPTASGPQRPGGYRHSAASPRRPLPGAS
jgi:hypothetical protein